MEFAGKAGRNPVSTVPGRITARGAIHSDPKYTPTAVTVVYQETTKTNLRTWRRAAATLDRSANPPTWSVEIDGLVPVEHIVGLELGVAGPGGPGMVFGLEFRRVAVLSPPKK